MARSRSRDKAKFNHELEAAKYLGLYSPDGVGGSDAYGFGYEFEFKSLTERDWGTTNTISVHGRRNGISADDLRSLLKKYWVVYHLDSDDKISRYWITHPSNLAEYFASWIDEAEFNERCAEEFRSYLASSNKYQTQSNRYETYLRDSARVHGHFAIQGKKFIQAATEIPANSSKKAILALQKYLIENPLDINESFIATNKLASEFFDFN